MDIGAQIRQARESRGLSREVIAKTTRVPGAALAAIERNDIASLPPSPYNRGFIEAYAREVGLEPHATASNFLRQFEPPRPLPPLAHSKRVSAEVLIEGPPQRLTWLALPAIALLLLVLITRGSTPENALPPEEGVGLDESDVAPASVQEPPVPADDVPSQPSGLSAQAGAVSVVITANRIAWVDAHADGRRVLYELLEAGTERRVSADRDITMRVGDAAAVSLVVNGRRTGPLGTSGQVRVLRITADSTQ